LAPTHYSPDFRRWEARGFARADIVRGTWPSYRLFVFRGLSRRSTHISQRTREAMTSLNEMSETEALDCMRAELQILNSILGELVPDFWKTLIDQWKKEGRHGISPVDRRFPSKNFQKWPLSSYWRETPCTDTPVATRPEPMFGLPSERARPESRGELGADDAD
jgi:hypothetical protein